MELKLPENIKKFYWTWFPIIFIIRGYHNAFISWKLQYYGFNELEDFGRVLFVFVLNACETALITVFLWWSINFLKRIFSKPSN